MSQEMKTTPSMIRRYSSLLLGGAVIFVAAIVYSFSSSVPNSSIIEERKDGHAIVKIASQTVMRSLDLMGTIEPGNVVNVTAPFDGPVKERYVNYGMRVERGQEMLSLNSAEVELKMRDAEVNAIKAAQRVDELQTWGEGSEVARVKNSVLSAQLKVAELTRKEQETQALLLRGIIPRNEYEGIVSQLKAQKLQLDAVRQDMIAVLKKGGEEHRHVAALELENATKRLEELKRQSGASIIEAPVSGLVLRPPESSDQDNKQANFEVGSQLRKGKTLLAIANTETLKVRARVNEIDVNRIREGQLVKVTGDAFGAVPLMGKVTQISVEADASSGTSRGAVFEMIAAVESIPVQLRERVRIGMSAKLSIITYKNDAALVVPIEAVQNGLDGTSVLRHELETGKKIRVPVTVGQTLENGIEILTGLKVGDSILVEMGRGTSIEGSGGQRPLLQSKIKPMTLQTISPPLMGGGSLGGN